MSCKRIYYNIELTSSSSVILAVCTAGRLLGLPEHTDTWILNQLFRPYSVMASSTWLSRDGPRCTCFLFLLRTVFTFSSLEENSSPLKLFKVRSTDYPEMSFVNAQHTKFQSLPLLQAGSRNLSSRYLQNGLNTYLNVLMQLWVRGKICFYDPLKCPVNKEVFCC